MKCAVVFALALGWLAGGGRCVGVEEAAPTADQRFRQELQQRWHRPNVMNHRALRSFLADFLQLFTLDVFPTAFSDKVSPACRADSQLYVQEYLTSSLSLNGSWATKMHEATGKNDDGWTLHSVGLFDQCLDVQPPQPHNFVGRYITVYLVPFVAPETSADRGDGWQVDPRAMRDRAVRDASHRRTPIALLDYVYLLADLFNPGSATPLPPNVTELLVTDSFPFVWFYPSVGFCLPSSCSAVDLRSAVNEVVGSHSLGEAVILTATDDYQSFSKIDPAREFDGATIAVITILSILGFLVVTATLHEGYRSFTGQAVDVSKSGPAVKVLHCFSALNNGRKLLSTAAPPGSFTCLHGIRVLSTTWVVMGHFWSNAQTNNLTPFLVDKSLLRWDSLGLTNATVSVDTFFVMSGFLACFLLLRELDRCVVNGSVRWDMVGGKTLLSYVHRYLRLTPVYAIVLAFIATLMVYCGDGPNWYSVEVSAEGCRKDAWLNLLYINNYVEGTEVEDTCMGHTWYLAVDMQLFIVTPLIVLPLAIPQRWCKILGLIWLGSITAGSLIADFILYDKYDLEATIFPKRSISPEYFPEYYGRSYARAAPYLVGILLGWIVHESRKPDPLTIKASKQAKRVGAAIAWALAAATALAIIYGVYPYLDWVNVPELPRAFNMTYGPLHRFAWAIVVGWVIFACLNGYGGFVNTLLSWGGFIPLGRLTYCVYLIHYEYITLYYGHMRWPIYYTDYDEVHAYLGLLFAVTLLSFFVSVTVEAPFLNLEKLIFAPLNQRRAPASERKPLAADDSKSSSEATNIKIDDASADNPAFVRTEL